MVPRRLPPTVVAQDRVDAFRADQREAGGHDQRAPAVQAVAVAVAVTAPVEQVEVQRRPVLGRKDLASVRILVDLDHHLVRRRRRRGGGRSTAQ
jgi:hypothetical protein